MQADSPKDSPPFEPPTPTSSSFYRIYTDIVFFVFALYGMAMFLDHTIHGYPSPAQAQECSAVPACPTGPEYPAVLACPAETLDVYSLEEGTVNRDTSIVT
jgi:hypothetical protein